MVRYSKKCPKCGKTVRHSKLEIGKYICKECNEKLCDSEILLVEIWGGEKYGW